MRDLIEKEDNFQGMTPSHKPPRKSKTPQERKARDNENFREYMQGVDDYQCLKARGAQHRMIKNLARPALCSNDTMLILAGVKIWLALLFVRTILCLFWREQKHNPKWTSITYHHTDEYSKCTKFSRTRTRHNLHH